MSDISNKVEGLFNYLADQALEITDQDDFVKIYTHDELYKLIKTKKRLYPSVAKCIISIQKKEMFDNYIFANSKYVIRIVMMDANDKLINVNNLNNEEYVGAVYIADAIDKKLFDYMGGKTEKSVFVNSTQNIRR